MCFNLAVIYMKLQETAHVRQVCAKHVQKEADERLNATAENEKTKSTKN